MERVSAKLVTNVSNFLQEVAAGSARACQIAPHRSRQIITYLYLGRLGLASASNETLHLLSPSELAMSQILLIVVESRSSHFYLTLPAHKVLLG